MFRISESRVLFPVMAETVQDRCEDRAGQGSVGSRLQGVSEEAGGEEEEEEARAEAGES